MRGPLRNPGPYALAISIQLPGDDGGAMNKRFVAVPLWFLTGWMVAAMAAFVLGLPGWIAPVTAVVVAVVVALDPAGWFSPRTETTSADGSARSLPAVLSPSSKD